VPGAHDNRRDRKLLGSLAGGRAEALAELYDRHAASLFRHALALARQRSDAEDLVQAVFMKLAAMGAELLGVREPASYLHRILRTTWIDGQRRNAAGRRAVEHTEHDRPATVGPCQPAFEDTLDIARTLDALPAVQREAIVLHLIEGFSFREIGRLTGVSLFTAAGRYRLGIIGLRGTLGRTHETTRASS
jgi:RNA polymerase sigma-70 factor, ECF subfamily